MGAAGRGNRVSPWSVCGDLLGPLTLEDWSRDGIGAVGFRPSPASAESAVGQFAAPLHVVTELGRVPISIGNVDMRLSR